MVPRDAPDLSDINFSRLDAVTITGIKVGKQMWIFSPSNLKDRQNLRGIFTHLHVMDSTKYFLQKWK